MERLVSQVQKGRNPCRRGVEWAKAPSERHPKVDAAPPGLFLQIERLLQRCHSYGVCGQVVKKNGQVVNENGRGANGKMAEAGSTNGARFE